MLTEYSNLVIEILYSIFIFSALVTL